MRTKGVVAVRCGAAFCGVSWQIAKAVIFRIFDRKKSGIVIVLFCALPKLRRVS